MIAFRKTLDHSQLAPTQQRLCMGVLGRFVKHKSREQGLALYERLKQVVIDLRPPQWARSAQQLCQWFWGLLKSLFKPTRPRRFDFNQYQWELVAKEKEWVKEKRGDGNLSADESWERWFAEQRSNEAWIKLRADLARQKLRESKVEAS